MKSILLEDCIERWINVKKDKKNPFRFFTLSTVAHNGSPNSRTVVLRDFNKDNFTFTIYSDYRSQKITELNSDCRAQLLFYDAKRSVQVVVSVNCISIIKNENTFKSIPNYSKKDYLSKLAPGDIITSPDAIDYEKKLNYFTELELQATAIDYLQLKRNNHLRIKYISSDGWSGVFLNP